MQGEIAKSDKLANSLCACIETSGRMEKQTYFLETHATIENNLGGTS